MIYHSLRFGARSLIVLAAFLTNVCVMMYIVTPAVAQSAGAFSRIGFGSRGIALGNALAADAFGPASPFYNPALAPYAERQHLDLSVASLSFDRTLQHIQLASPMQRAGIALGLIHSSVSKIDGRDNSGFHTRELSIDEFQGFLAFGIRLSEDVSGGLTFQFFQSDLFDTLDPAISIAVDIGLNFRLSKTLSLAFVADDLLGRYTWNTSGVNGSGGKETIDYFPTRLRVGVAKTFIDGALLLLGEIESRTSRVEAISRNVEVFGTQPVEVTDRETLTLQETRVRAGVEYHIVPRFALRAGLEQLGSDIMDKLRPSAGFMISEELGKMDARFEYTFAREVEAAGSMHVVSLLIFF